MESIKGSQMPNNKDAKGKPAIDLVTGASSGIGRDLVDMLLAEGHEVRALLLHSPITSRDWMSLPPSVKLYIADLTSSAEADQRVLEEACDNVDNIFHLAGASYNFNHTYDELINTNVVGTDNLLSACQIANRQSTKMVHFIYASSVTVYGYKRIGQVLDENAELKPASPYSESKEMAERVIKSFAETDPKIRYTIMRFGTLYGPHYKDSFFKVFKLIKEGKALYVGSGLNHLTLTHEMDAARIMFLASQSQKSLNNVYNATDGVAYTVKWLFEFVAKELGVQPPTRKVPHTIAKIMRPVVNIKSDELEFLASDRTVSIERARGDMDYVPKEKIEKAGLELIEQFEKSEGSRVQQK